MKQNPHHIQFLTELSVTPLPTPGGYWKRLCNSKKWRLNAVLRFIYCGKEYEIPAGFVFDFASVPRFLKPLLPDDALYGYAAVVHDWLYRMGIVDKWMADAILRELLITQDRQPAAIAFLMWQAVDWFGYAAWNENRRRHQKQ